MVNRLFSPGSLRGRVMGRQSNSIKGGSILLQQGGPGAGSSYTSVEDFHHTTGRGVGVGMEGVNEKLKSLMVPPLKKTKNIRFTLN